MNNLSDDKKLDLFIKLQLYKELTTKPLLQNPFFAGLSKDYEILFHAQDEANS